MAKATFPAQSQSVAETTKPADADGFAASDHRNVGSALFQGDLSPLRPRANSPATMKINVTPAEIEGFFRQVYGNSNHVKFAGGDSPTFSAPGSNNRIDLLYLDVSSSPTGTLTILQGTAAASPSEPALPSSLDKNIPLCYVYLKSSTTKIVNYEDKDADTAQGYIYRDVRPWIGGGGGATFGVTPVTQAFGDTAAEGSVGSGESARALHRHGMPAGALETGAWADVTGSRAISTSYQNTSGKKRRVSVKVIGGANSNISTGLFADPSNGPTNGIARVAIPIVTTGGAQYVVTLYIEVPNNWYYYVSDGVGNAGISQWWELNE